MSDSADVAKSLFINGERELRSGWRVLAFYLCFLLCALLIMNLGAAVLAPILGAQAPGDDSSTRAAISFAVNRALLLIPALIATAICARLLEGRSLSSVGYKLHKGWLRDFLVGSLVGAVTLAVAVLIAAAGSAVSFDVQTTRVALLAEGLGVLFLTFLVAAAFEEIFVRGFPFQALLHNLGPIPAVVITSALFALLHVNNPNVTFFSIINTILAGMWLGVAYLMTRSLWLATALHYSWNLAMIFVFGLPVSGLTQFDHLAWLDGQPEPPEWLSGGSYGPEGGAAATIALIISTLVIWRSRLFVASDDMRRAIKHGKKRLYSTTENSSDFGF